MFDYPSRWSAAALEAAARYALVWVLPKIEAYRVFSSRAVRAVLMDEGFRLAGEHRQFVLPIALHKWIGSETWTRRIEGRLARAGLLRLFGSPVTVVAERCAS